MGLQPFLFQGDQVPKPKKEDKNGGHPSKMEDVLK